MTIGGGGGGGEGGDDSNASRRFERVGYVAVGPYGADDAATRAETLFSVAGPRGRPTVAAQIDRLCVPPSWRGRRYGVKEALLRACDGFTAQGLPVRVKARPRDRFPYDRVRDVNADP
jgi:GNAT superfamily N-acetyltransferase